MPDPKPPRLPSRSSGEPVIAGMLGALEHLVTGRPKPVAEIHEQYEDEWASADGVTVHGLEDRPQLPEPPDRSGARI